MTRLLEIIRLKEKPLAVKGVEVEGGPFQFELKHLAGSVSVKGGTRLTVDGVGHFLVTDEEAELIWEAKREMQGVGV